MCVGGGGGRRGEQPRGGGGGGSCFLPPLPPNRMHQSAQSHWQELPQVSFLSRQKYACRDKIMSNLIVALIV